MGVHAAVASCCALMALGACTDELSETLVEVDTNLPIPAIVNRLRVDVFDRDGRWVDSRDTALPEVARWPVSFSVVAPSERDDRALVRVRAYAEARLQDVRDAPRRADAPTPAYDPAEPSRGLEGVCSQAQTLELGQQLRLRRGPWLRTTTGQLTSGAAAATIQVREAGAYTFRVAALWPTSASGRQLLPAFRLQLQTQCGSPETTLVDGGAQLSFDAVLDAERSYTLLFSGGDDVGEPAELLVELSRAGAALPPASSGGELDAAPSAAPRWFGEGGEPGSEPQASSAVDRLAWIAIERAEGRTVRLLLDLDCAGVPSVLALDDGRLVPERSTTCIDGQRKSTLLEVERSRAGIHVSPRRRESGPAPYPAGGCGVLLPHQRCVAGGTFLFGGPEFRGFGVGSSWPERVAVLSSFRIDADEVTVARFRAARLPLERWEQPLAQLPPSADLPGLGNPESAQYCTWTDEPGPNEQHPLNCVSWYTARKFCQALGGELPTEAQWEYAATRASKQRETPWPWHGEMKPSCDHAVYGRSLLLNGTECPRHPLGPAPLSPDTLDVTPEPSSIYRLAGSLAEWMLDGAHPLDGACWRGAALQDPACLEPNALLRSQRGGNWADSSEGTRALNRSREQPGRRDTQLGFRCAYAAAP